MNDDSIAKHMYCHVLSVLLKGQKKKKKKKKEFLDILFGNKTKKIEVRKHFFAVQQGHLHYPIPTAHFNENVIFLKAGVSINCTYTHKLTLAHSLF